MRVYFAGSDKLVAVGVDGYCGRYLASDDIALDAGTQVIGRTFEELKMESRTQAMIRFNARRKEYRQR